MKLPFKASTFVFFIFLFLVAWINLPKNIPIKFDLGPIHVNSVTMSPVIDFTLFDKKYHKEFETKLGLDLKGGSHLLFEADMKKIPTADQESALTSARNIIEQRVNFYGVSEPQVQTIKAGDKYRISIDLPGVENVEQAIALIGQTAQLDFKEQTMIDVPKDNPIATQTAQLVALAKSTGLGGKHVKKAYAQLGQQNSGSAGGNLGSASVALEFDKEGAKMFEEITERNIGKPLGIALDDQIISAPTVNARISGGNAVITGDFTLEQAENLASSINSGALPVPIKLIEQRNIGPSLGKDAIDKSVFAGLIGLSTVVLFMILYYGRYGLIAATGLLIYGLISYAIFRAIPIVLTLPGIAGFILSIGMAVDSNILIFERIKEEQRKGRTFHTAINLGFGHAIDAIKDANIATLLVAFILFNPLNWEFFPQFGLIRGFALTLAIGVATSLFTGVVITKRLILLVFRNKLGKQ